MTYMDKQTNEFELATQQLAKDIIGEIVLSDSPESVIRKWRSIFKISQKELAAELGITSSVVSDYESGRRSSPGIKVIRKYVDSLLKIDSRKGGNVIRSFSKNVKSEPLSEAIIEIKELHGGVKVSDFCRNINSVVINGGANLDQQVYGYTIIDSLKAITELSFPELIKLYGITTQRALIFTKVSTGRSPMVAIKMSNLRPAVVVLHGLSSVDDVAKRIAEVEGIPLAVCRIETVEGISSALKKLEG
jgi:putative transcriptional regulator